jgi:hypothetical protein
MLCIKSDFAKRLTELIINKKKRAVIAALFGNKSLIFYPLFGKFDKTTSVELCHVS